MNSTLSKYRYTWPFSDLTNDSVWEGSADNLFLERAMPETIETLSTDSRWPAFYPSQICFVTVSHGSKTALERCVGASIVNRFPYILALSICRKNLSERHYDRAIFSEMVEKSGSVAVQFLSPGASFDNALNSIKYLSEDSTHKRIDCSQLKFRKAFSNNAPVFADAYMVYEASLVEPKKDFDGVTIYSTPWLDVGSHRLYFFEINAIQLREDIALGNSQISWRSLPAWESILKSHGFLSPNNIASQEKKYTKTYTPHYVFPSAGTTAFEFDTVIDRMAVKQLSPLPENQIEVDNDKARWPCFFPSSLSMVTSWAENNTPNVMPCGSTMVVSRHPMTIAICVAYASINVRYSPRASLNIIRENDYFGCGVPFVNNHIIKAIEYSGNTSLSEDKEKVYNSGLEYINTDNTPTLSAIPIHFECRVVDEIKLGTHSMFLGQVQKIRVRRDVTVKNPLKWFPYAEVQKA